MSVFANPVCIVRFPAHNLIQFPYHPAKSTAQDQDPHHYCQVHFKSVSGSGIGLVVSVQRAGKEVPNVGNNYYFDFAILCFRLTRQRTGISHCATSSWLRTCQKLAP